MRKIGAIALLGTVILSATGMCQAKEIDMTPFNPARRPGVYSKTRDETCLNGVWKISPIYDKEFMYLDEFPDPETPPDKLEWHDVLVPGFFRSDRPGTDIGMRLPDGACIPEEWNKAQRVWYQKEFNAPSEWKDRTLTLRFDAVAYYAKVFVNGVPVGEHFGALTPFTFDIGDVVEFGQTNTLAVYVIGANRVSFCPEGVKGYAAFGRTAWIVLPEVWAMRSRNAGIWQDVFLEAKPEIHIDDIFVMPSFRRMEIAARVRVKNQSSENKAYLLALDILDMQGNKVIEFDRRDIALLAGTSGMMELSRPWQDPQLWDIDQPNLYYMRARLHDYGPQERVVDEKLVRFGFRECWVEKDQIYLNGRVFHPLGDWLHDNNIGTHCAARRYEYYVAKYRALRTDVNFVCPRQEGFCGQDAYDAADELGFPLIPTGYAGNKIDARGFPNCVKEWTAYIKSLRNHPSVLIWSVQNESHMPFKTHEFFVLQRKLDQLIEELDPTRPYYHDGHARILEDDPGAVYENCDCVGNAPMSGGHYTTAKTPMSTWMHEFDRWRKKKPFIYGEAGTFGYRDIPAYAQRFYGPEYNKDDLQNMGGRVVKMVLGCWRSYAVSGIMPNGFFPQYSWSRNRKYNVPTLKWNDLNTPGPKPFSLPQFYCSFFNPYEPDNQPARVTTYGQWVKKAFAPLLVTLYRELRHNYCSIENAEKSVYIVNDTTSDAVVKLAWKLADAQGNIIAEHTEPVLATQGRPTRVNRLFVMPSVAEPVMLKLSVHAETEDGLFTADDEQELSVYPEQVKPVLTKEYHVYERSDNVKHLLKEMGRKPVPFGPDTFSGNVPEKVLIIGPDSFDDNLNDYYEKLDVFISQGGVLIVLNQKVDYPWTGSSNLAVGSPEQTLFNGLANARVYFWAGRDNILTDSGLQLPEKGVYIKHMGASYFEMRKGKGALVGCNLLLAEKYDIEPEARILLHNLLRYADTYEPGSGEDALEQPGPDVYFQPFKLLKETIVNVKKLTAEQRDRFHFVNLKFHANGVFRGARFNPSFSNVEFKMLPAGDWSFAGVPFHVVDSDNDEFLGGDPGTANSVIILKGVNQPKYPERAENIPIERKARRLHFLHTAAWAHIKEAEPEYDAIFYRVTYKDGTTAQATAKNKVHLRDWWFRIREFEEKLPGAPVGWAERNMEGSYVYKTIWVQSWDNPYPDKEIKSLDIISAGNCVPLVFAVTTEN